MSPDIQRLHRLLATAVAYWLHECDGDVRLSICAEDSRLWSLWCEVQQRDLASGPDPIAMLEGWLRAQGVEVP